MSTETTIPPYGTILPGRAAMPHKARFSARWRSLRRRRNRQAATILGLQPGPSRQRSRSRARDGRWNRSSAAFEKADPTNARFFRPSTREGHAMFDLPGYIVARLLSLGVLAADLSRCTYAEEELFFSYRRATHRGESDYGRLLSAITLE